MEPEGIEPSSPGSQALATQPSGPMFSKCLTGRLQAARFSFQTPLVSQLPSHGKYLRRRSLHSSRQWRRQSVPHRILRPCLSCLTWAIFIAGALHFLHVWVEVWGLICTPEWLRAYWTEELAQP